MAFREVRVFEVREVLRLWLAGEGIRATERLVGFDRKTVRRYVDAAVGLGLVRDGGDDQLTDVFIGLVVEAVRPHRCDGHGEAWRLLQAHHDEIAVWVADDLTAVKVFELLERRGVSVPCRTVQRYVAEVCGRTRGRGPTVRVNDGEPGDELQIDFGRMGLIFDPVTGRNRVVHTLIFTACLQPALLRVAHASSDHRRGDRWLRGGVGVLRWRVQDVDPRQHVGDRRWRRCARTAVESGVRRVRAGAGLCDRSGPCALAARTSPASSAKCSSCAVSFFAGETFIDLADAQRRAESWCRERAGMRVHGTTQQRPVEVFTAEEAPRLWPAPTDVYDVPIYATAKVHRDHHVEVARSLYSVPGTLIGARVEVRADRAGADLPPRPAHQGPSPPRTRQVARPIPTTCRRTRRCTRCATSSGSGHGRRTRPAIGTYASALLDIPLPWTRCVRSTRCWGS